MRILQACSVLALSGLVLSSCVATALVGAGVEATRAVSEERTTLQQLKDTEIQLGLNNKFLNHSGRLFGDVSTSVIEGRVVLTGSVPLREDKIAATDLAWQTPGVAEVTDELTVQQDSGAVAYAEDAWISNRLRFNLLTDKNISSVNYNVETVDKVVHLTGLARSRTELTRVLDRASSVPGVTRVVSHVLTIDDPRRIAAKAPQSTGG